MVLIREDETMKTKEEIIEYMKSQWRCFHKTGSDIFMAKAQTACWVLNLSDKEIEKIFLEIQKED